MGWFATHTLLAGLLLAFLAPKLGLVIAGVGVVLFALHLLGYLLS